MDTPPANVASGSDSSFYVPPGSTDPAWQYGYLSNRTDPNTVTCRLCKKVVKGGVYRFKQHLAHRRGNVAACPKVDEDTKKKMIAYLDDVARKKSQKAVDVQELRDDVDITGDAGSAKRPRASDSLEQNVALEGASRQMTIKDAFSKEHRDRVTPYIANWAYTSTIPFNALTTKPFVQMVEAIGKYGPGLKTPTRYELSGPLLKDAVKKMHDDLQCHRDTWKSTGCSLMTDAWTDMRGRSIINFCVNCTLGTSFLKSIDASNEAHTADYIFKLVDECLNEVGIDNVVQIVADNASANVAAGRLLLTKYPRIWWTPCAAHSLDLALEEISKETKVRSAITKAKKLTVFIYSHTKTLSLMRKFTNKRDIARPGQTRFATTFLTLESLNEKKDKLRLMFSSEEWRNCKWYKAKRGEAASSIVFSLTFWNHIAHAVRVFTPLVRLLRVVDADRRPSMGFVYGGLEEAKREIVASFNGVESSYKFFVDGVTSKTKGRLDTPLHLATYYLNPFFFYTESRGDPDVVVRRGFKECMERFYPDLDVQDAITRDELPACRLGRGDFGKPLAVRQRMTNDNNYDPANWWHNHGDDTPHLKAMAIKILSLTSSSSGCERNWSTFDSVPEANELVVRVVSSVDRSLEVLKLFSEIFEELKYPKEFSYKSKAILLFQTIKGADVCLFGMYVQEYGSKCGPPNQRHIYLSYIDSVKYFQPDIKALSGEALRTLVYHEILIAYLDYSKRRGFASCYIWVCPATKREDFIFNCHPEKQKMPKKDKLREWYFAMVEKATKEDIVVHKTNIYDQFFVPANDRKDDITAARLPYFDGDYWPGIAEKVLDNLQEQEEGKEPQKKGKIGVSRRAMKAVRHSTSPQKSKDILLMNKLEELILPKKEDFILLHLQHSCNLCYQLIMSGKRWVCNLCKKFQLCEKCHDKEQELDDKDRHPIGSSEKHSFTPVDVNDVPENTTDEDENMQSEIFDSRIAFLGLCQAEHYQYDTLRHAKYSTMMILYHIHNAVLPSLISVCAFCHCDIKAGQCWHCEACPDYDLCYTCYLREGRHHCHPLVGPQNFAFGEEQSISSQHRHAVLEKNLVEILEHASACFTVTCSYKFCRHLKIFFRHCAECRVRLKGGCPRCKKIWYLLRLHAQSCSKQVCQIPRCLDLRTYLSRSKK